MKIKAIYYIFFVIIFFSNIKMYSQKVKIKNGKIITSDSINMVDKDGYKYGVWLSKSEDGLMKVDTYVNDTLDGSSKIYRFSDGKLLHEEQYAKGKRNGQYIDYSEEGKIKLIQHYKNDKLHGNIKWYYKGVLIEDMNYKYGLKDGVYKWYFDNGNLSLLENYKNGKLFGEGKHYYKNGNLRYEGDANNYGPSKFYSKKGILKKIRFYDDNGHYIKTQIFDKKGVLKKEFINKKMINN